MLRRSTAIAVDPDLLSAPFAHEKLGQAWLLPPLESGAQADLLQSLGKVSRATRNLLYPATKKNLHIGSRCCIALQPAQLGEKRRRVPRQAGDEHIEIALHEFVAKPAAPRVCGDHPGDRRGFTNVQPGIEHHIERVCRKSGFAEGTERREERGAFAPVLSPARFGTQQVEQFSIAVAAVRRQKQSLLPIAAS